MNSINARSCALNLNQDKNEKEIKSENTALVDHLIDLRRCLLRAGLAVLFVFLTIVYWAPEIFRYFATPLINHLPLNGKLIVTDITGSFLVPIKVTAMVSLMIALPMVLYQIWLFVAPGLYKNEKKLVLPLITSSYILFLMGIAFAYLIVFPALFQIVAHYNAPLGVEMMTDIEKYLSFALTMFLCFGIVFEVPIIVVLLVYTGFTTIQKLTAFRSYMIIGAFIIAAIVTPPDVVSQFFLAIPLILLYELGTLISKMVKPSAHNIKN